MTLSLDQIDQGIDALLDNAAQLVKEGTALLEVPSYPRAFTLGHLAREEMSKAAMLQATGARLLAEHEVNWKQLMVRLRDHRAKLRLEIFETLLLVQGLGIVEESEIFRAVAAHIAE